MTRLVFVTQVIDPDDPVLGVAVELAGALAARSDRLLVIANEVRADPPLDAEVVSLGKEDGATRAVRAARYIRAVRHAARDLRADALLAHMCPEYLNLAAPVAKPSGLRLMLWYAHPGRSAHVRMAARLADVILTSLPGTFPFPNRKLRQIGQAIDLRAFPRAAAATRDDGLRLLALGRTSPVKAYPTLIGAVALARRGGLDVALRVVGTSSTPEERRHRDDLGGLVTKLGLDGIIRLEPGVPRIEIAGLLGSSDALVNATRSGSGDKAVFEAMAVGRPVLLSNRSFAPLVAGLPIDPLFEPGDERGLADRIGALAALPAGARDAIGTQLRERIEAGHSLDHWADRVVEAASAGRRRGSRSAPRPRR